MMESITRSINIVAILTKNKYQSLSSIFIFLKIATMFKLLVILHYESMSENRKKSKKENNKI